MEGPTLNPDDGRGNRKADPGPPPTSPPDPASMQLLFKDVKVVPGSVCVCVCLCVCVSVCVCVHAFVFACDLTHQTIMRRAFL